ncbi:putative glutathione s-transferase protein [gamma proteobacterium IMCC1989]|nr:putative glutathione s-transferase protein [gamma proteobacterium IMCC1989]
MHLYIAYKNYSSWSLRPWIAMKVAGIPFDETLLPFYHDDSLKTFAEVEGLPAKVPVLKDQGRTIWDSLAILEYLADQYPEAKLWPSDPTLKALARCATAEMHSGFMALRGEFPMNCRTNVTVAPSEATQKDLQRLAKIWADFSQQQKPEGDFLCGHFTIVDAMYSAVMWRVTGYNLPVSEEFDRWAKAMLALPAMQEWLTASKAESWSVAQYDKVAGI